MYACAAPRGAVFFFAWSEIKSCLSPLQVPDMIRKVDMKDAGKSISGPHKRSKRRPFRTEADKRGVAVRSSVLTLYI